MGQVRAAVANLNWFVLHAPHHVEPALEPSCWPRRVLLAEVLDLLGAQSLCPSISHGQVFSELMSSLVLISLVSCKLETCWTGGGGHGADLPVLMLEPSQEVAGPAHQGTVDSRWSSMVRMHAPRSSGANGRCGEAARHKALEHAITTYWSYQLMALFEEPYEYLARVLVHVFLIVLTPRSKAQFICSWVIWICLKRATVPCIVKLQMRVLLGNLKLIYATVTITYCRLLLTHQHMNKFRDAWLLQNSLGGLKQQHPIS